MNWPLRLLAPDELSTGVPGECWYEPSYPLEHLSAEYLRDHAGRAPLVVLLPDGSAFCVDSCATGKSTGWTVTGTAPQITVSPSIHVIERYHGWIRDGVLTDDCEGRTYPPRVR